MENFTGTIRLIPFLARRDRVSLLAWSLLLPLMPILSLAALVKLYPDEASLSVFIKLAASDPLQTAMLGEVYAANLGAAMCWKWLTQYCIFIGIFNLFFVIKHTRNEEASGRYELLASTPIGRYSIPAATFILAICMNLLIAMLCAGYLLAYGQDLEGVVAMGLGCGLTGILMAALALFVAQLSAEPGAARGIMGALIALFYVLNIGYNSGAAALFWVSPLTWLYELRPFGAENWLVLLLPLASSLLLVSSAYYLLSKRDFNSGIFRLNSKEKPVSPLLNNPFALSWRLHRNMIFWWTLSCLVMGLLLGKMMDTVAIQVGENPQFKAFLTLMGDVSMADAMFSLMFTLFAQAYAFYIVMAIGKLPQEELSNRSETLLALPLSRGKWAAAHLAMVLLGVCLMLFAFGAGAGIAYGYVNDDLFPQTQKLISASFVFLPALLLFAAVAFLVFAIKPQLYYLSWISLVFVILLDLVREIYPNQTVLSKLSPFGYVPKILLGEHNWQGLVGVGILGLLLGGLGLYVYRKRDLV